MFCVSGSKIPVLIGGSHITGLPESIMCDYFDVGIVSEGEETLLAAPGLEAGGCSARGRFARWEFNVL